jgi:hypothetical protein
MKYLSYYDVSDNEGRNFCLSATNKINYICKAISENGENVKIISASIASTKGHFRGGESLIAKGVSLKKFSAYKWGNSLQKIWVTIYSFLAIVFYLLLHVKKDERIIVYHSLGYMRAVSLAKFIKRFYLIMEIEEIYSDVLDDPKGKKRELKFFKKADAYIFPTELLNEKINIYDRPKIIIHGTYNNEKEICKSVNDGIIHCVYAGTFNVQKGVGVAINTAKYLDENYHVHILGFGSEKEIKYLLELIEEVSKTTKCRLTYDGLLSGEEYLKFIQSCHIGLSTQRQTAAFNETSFPSKVLSYLSNGLRVVSVKIRALETSAVNDLLFYYEGDDPMEVARTIKLIDVKENYDSRQRINKLDFKFRKEIMRVLKY